MPLTIGYFDVRGMCEQIILMLEYLGEDYVRKVYPTIVEDQINFGAWFDEEKPAMDKVFDYPNIPYIIDGEVRLTETFAIMKYLARKHKDLLPNSEDEMQKCDQAQGLVEDIRGRFIKSCFDSQVRFEPDGRQANLAWSQAKLSYFDKLLRKQAWLAGDRLTFVDFAMCEFLDHLCLCTPEALDGFPQVAEYKESFEKLPRIKAFRESSRFKKYPVFTMNAHWGYAPK